VPTYYPPPVFWHYTTADALIQILRSGSVFATAFHHLNDKAEVEHAREILWPVLEAAVESEAPPDAKEAWFEQVKGWWSVAGVPVSGSGDRTIEGVPCVFSLSEDPDSLEQWRAYGGHAGVAIGFRHDRLRSLDQVSFVRCEYPKKGEAPHARHAFASLTQRMIADLRNGGFMTTNYQDLFFNLAVTVKDYAFRNEREWRLVTARQWPAALSLRGTESRVVPYWPIRLVEDVAADASDDARWSRWNGTIVDIRVGPGRHASLTLDALSRTLGAHGIEVAPSGIPYRSLT
jgi:hypothetical protein